MIKHKKWIGKIFRSKNMLISRYKKIRLDKNERITDFEKDEEGYYNVKVALFEDFNQLNFVYVIHSSEAIEQEKLEMKIKNE